MRLFLVEHSATCGVGCEAGFRKFCIVGAESKSEAKEDSMTLISRIYYQVGATDWEMRVTEQEKAAEALRSGEDDTIEQIRGWWIDAGGDGDRFEWESTRKFLRRLSPAHILEAIQITKARMIRQAGD